jgi:hypothetical protein
MEQRPDENRGEGRREEEREEKRGKGAQREKSK